MGFQRKKGEVVTVYNLRGGRKIVIEGKAKLVKPIQVVAEGELERWLVRFLDDKKPLERNIWTKGHEPTLAD